MWLVGWIHNDNDELYLTLDVATTYRLTKDYDKAILMMESLSPCIKIYDESQITYYNNWFREISNEKMLADGDINIYQFDQLEGTAGRTFKEIRGSIANIDSITINNFASNISATISTFDGDGNQYIISSVMDSSVNVHLRKTNTSGYIEWEQVFDGFNKSCDSAIAIAIDVNNFLYVTGKSWNGYDFDVITNKYDTAGNHYWTAIYNDIGLGNDRPVSIEVDSLFKIQINAMSYSDSVTVNKTIYYSQCDTNCFVNMRTVAQQAANTPQEFSLKLRPNPARNTFNIIISGEDQKSNYLMSIYNIMGQVVLKQRIVSGSDVSISKFAQGVYEVEVYKPDSNKISRTRLVVE